jgi:hypothetical protein
VRVNHHVRIKAETGEGFCRLPVPAYRTHRGTDQVFDLDGFLDRQLRFGPHEDGIAVGVERRWVSGSGRAKFVSRNEFGC